MKKVKRKATRNLPPLIAHIIYRLDVGGLENGLVNIINTMPEGSYQHVVICLTGYSSFKNRLKKRDVKVYALNKREGKDYKVYIELWKLLRRLRPDIVHTRNLASIDCAVVATLAGVPIRIHGEHGRDVIDLDGTNKKYLLLRRVCEKFIDKFIPMSVDLASWLHEVVGIPESKIERIYNGVDKTKFHPVKRNQSGNYLVGYVGRFEPVKDPMNLLKAFHYLVDRKPEGVKNLRLAIIGDGPLRVKIENYIRDSGLEDLVWVPGSRDDVDVQLQEFSIFALPSLAEGISNTILEAMASGLPVVATRVGGSPEIVIEGETGFLVPAKEPRALAEALLTYIKNPELMIMHGENARKIIEEKFSISRMVDQYQAIYDKLTN